MSEIYKIEKVSLQFDSNAFPQLSTFEYDAFLTEQFANFVGNLPKNVDYIALQDLTPAKVQTKFHYINGAPAVRQLRQYQLPTNSFLDRIDAEYVVVIPPVEPTAEPAPTTPTVN